MVSGTRAFYSGSSGSLVGGVGPPWIRPAQQVSQMLDQIEIWGILRPGQHLGPFICVPRVASEQCLLCVRAHCPAGSCHRVVLLC